MPSSPQAAGALPGGRRRRTADVTDYVGLAAAEAIEAARAAGLRPAPERVESGEPGQDGLVVAQEPVAGSPAPRDGVLTLRVAARAEPGAGAVSEAERHPQAYASTSDASAANVLRGDALAEGRDAVAPADGSASDPAPFPDVHELAADGDALPSELPAESADGGFPSEGVTEAADVREDEPRLTACVGTATTRRAAHVPSPRRWVVVAALGGVVFLVAVLVQEHPVPPPVPAPAREERSFRRSKPELRSPAPRRARTGSTGTRPRQRRRRTVARPAPTPPTPATRRLAPPVRAFPVGPEAPRAPDPQAAEFF